MTAENLPRFDIAALRRLAGSAFTRGEAYHRDGRVEILAIEPRRVLAQVAGTEDYRVNLLGKGETDQGRMLLSRLRRLRLLQAHGGGRVGRE
jgi:uncharacterized Zn finger protein